MGRTKRAAAAQAECRIKSVIEREAQDHVEGSRKQGGRKHLLSSKDQNSAKEKKATKKGPTTSRMRFNDITNQNARDRGTSQKVMGGSNRQPVQEFAQNQRERGFRREMTQIEYEAHIKHQQRRAERMKQNSFSGLSKYTRIKMQPDSFSPILNCRLVDDFIMEASSDEKDE